MSDEIGGSRQRPRVALLGDFDAELVEAYQRLFPTIWRAATGDELFNLIHPDELDLLIIGLNLQNLSYVGNYVHEYTKALM